MKKKRRFGVALAVCAALANSHSATADLIDSFGETYQRVVDPPLGPDPNTDERALSTTPFEGLGATRYLSVARTSGSGSGNVSLTIDDDSNRGLYEGTVTAVGSFTLGYDGTVDGAFAPNETDGLNLDFSATDGLSLFANSDFGAALDFRLFNGTEAFTSTMNIPASGGGGSLQEYFLPFDSFTGSGILDASNIDAISIVSAAGTDQARDVEFTLLRTKSVPEPGSVLLLALSGVGFGGAGQVLRWRRGRRESSARPRFHNSFHSIP